MPSITKAPASIFRFIPKYLPQSVERGSPKEGCKSESKLMLGRFHLTVGSMRIPEKGVPKNLRRPNGKCPKADQHFSSIAITRTGGRPDSRGGDRPPGSSL
ncbi:hypothetical protein SBA4_3340014 [Candidatus Sulfopaludibacter sp. SbA4]|nr:hypothetical protein SBA4_3340014 [Candidatus Sulfopaludibacter sp. SbA4]